MVALHCVCVCEFACKSVYQQTEAPVTDIGSKHEEESQRALRKEGNDPRPYGCNADTPESRASAQQPSTNRMSRSHGWVTYITVCKVTLLW